nr:hypothetical protein Iba_chr14cCG12450 [Ipomoea batatas]
MGRAGWHDEVISVDPTHLSRPVQWKKRWKSIRHDGREDDAIIFPRVSPSPPCSKTVQPFIFDSSGRPEGGVPFRQPPPFSVNFLALSGSAKVQSCIANMFLGHALVRCMHAQ